MAAAHSNTPIDPPLSAEEVAVRATLVRHVDTLAGLIGVRHDSRASSLDATVAYLERQWAELGQDVRRECYATARWEAKNLVVEWPGTTKPGEIVLLGAHYDTVASTPGADDNASAVAMMLAVCDLLRARRYKRTVRFVAFANEEPPHFSNSTMGSKVYARRCRERGDDIHLMVCLEMVGYYRTDAGSQTYPDELPAAMRRFLRPRGDFIAIVGDMPSIKRQHAFTRGFKTAAKFPATSVPVPRRLVDLWLSDHGPFWDEGYPAVMVTDTSWFRNPHYHEPTDTPDTLDYDRMARVAVGVAGGVARLAGAVKP